MRQDLAIGYQVVQSAHAVAEFLFQYPDISKIWKDESNSIICLGCKDLEDLNRLVKKLEVREIKFSLFFEPDINEVTAICIEPTEKARKICSYLPLCGKSQNEKGGINKHTNSKLEKLIRDMSNTSQFEDQSVLQHGYSVYEHYQKIRELLANNMRDISYPIPEVFYEYKDGIFDNLYEEGVLREYMVFHDCGKPYCLEVDENNKKHFPEHEMVSYETYLQVFKDSKYKEVVSRLILGDMDIHRLKDEGVEQFLKKDKKDIITHLLVGLAEIISNSKMFGGIESTNFKIKFKSLEQRSKKIFKNIFGSCQS